MQIAVFQHVWDKEPKNAEMSWSEMCRTVLAAHKEAPALFDKKQFPLFSPATFNGPRKSANVRDVHLAVLDYDSIDAEVLHNWRVENRDLAYVIYTTLSHPNEDGSWRLRIVLPFSRPVPAKQWAGAWRGVLGLVPPGADTQCKDPGRMYTLPYARTDQPRAHFLNQGKPLDTEALLRNAPPPVDTSSSRAVDATDLAEVAKKLKRSTKGRTAAAGRTLAKIANREPFSTAGGRHDAMLPASMEMERAFPHVTIDALTELWRPSLWAMAGPGFQPDMELDEVRRALEGARSKRLEWQAERDAAQHAEDSGRLRDAWRSVGVERDTRYTDAEVQAWAKNMGAPMKRRWIITHGASVYTFLAGDYRGPYPVNGADAALLRDLAPADGLPDGVCLKNDKNEWRSKAELCRDYGTVVERVGASFLLQQSHLDQAGRVLTEALAPLRKIRPQQSKLVDDWLRALCGKHYDELADWLALLTDLSQPLAALYLEGPAGTGKSLMAAGLSRLWTETGPTSAEVATSGFNDVLARCPFVFADEYMPSAWGRRGGIGRMREFVATQTHNLNRKYLPAVNIRGFLRLMLAANNAELVISGELLTEEDREAIAERVLHIPAQAEGRAKLSEYGVEGIQKVYYELAGHALWLRDQRPKARKCRFGVRGTSDVANQAMRLTHPINGAVSEWLVGFLLHPKEFDAAGRARQFARVDNGELLVNVNAFNSQQTWSLYVSHPAAVPSTYRLGRSLGEMANGRRKLGTVQFRVIDPELLIAYAETSGMATRQEIKEALNAPQR
jgi:hypothetical protein